MSKKVYLNQAAEKESTDIGRKFMNSTDVVGDMSRTYGTDLSSVRIHTDGSAAQRAAERGVDAFSTGKDVFFARNAFNQSDPASRGLLAHELSHSLQQGVGGEMGGMTQSAPMGAEQGGLLDWFRNLFSNKENRVSFAEDKSKAAGKQISQFWARGTAQDASVRFEDPDYGRSNLWDHLTNKKDGGGNSFLSESERARLDGKLRLPSGQGEISGLGAARQLKGFEGILGGNMSKDEVAGLYKLLLSDDVGQYQSGLQQLKGIQLQYLRHLRDKYGTYGSQMHPEEFISKLGPEFFDDRSALQDTEQMLVAQTKADGGGGIFDFENNADDREYKVLSDYYNQVFAMNLDQYMATDTNGTPSVTGTRAFKPNEDLLPIVAPAWDTAAAMEGQVGGPGFTEREQQGYNKRLKKRFGKNGWLGRLFGRFRAQQ